MNILKELLIDHLFTSNHFLASFAQVIICASDLLTKSSETNDFSHSEEVHKRLSELFKNEFSYNINDTEIFILCASAYLHDIGRSKICQKNHGERSAALINSSDNLKYLFPAVDIQNQVAEICKYHDREITDYRTLKEELILDIRHRYSYAYKNPFPIKIRPRFLTSIFRLADELECISDRFLSQVTNNDSRNCIAAVRIDSRSRSICFSFKHGLVEGTQQRCMEHFGRIITELKPFLKPYAFSYRLVETLPETPREDEKEELGTVFNSMENIEDLE
jgi:hypothetical protein